MDDSLIKFFEYINLYQPLTEDTKVELSNHLSILHLKKKEILIKENSRHDYAYYIIKGAVRSYYLKDGVEINTWFAFENDIVGSLLTFKERPSKETLELIEDSTFIAINLRTIKPITYHNLQISNFINIVIENYALYLEEKVHMTQMTSAMEKYALLLETEPETFQRVPLTYIASFLGISRETLSRMRAK